MHGRACAACAVWTRDVKDRVISKPEPPQVETLLRLRPPGINLKSENVIVYMHAYIRVAYI